MNDNHTYSRGKLVMTLPDAKRLFKIALTLFLCAEPIQYLLGLIGSSASFQRVACLLLVYFPLLIGILRKKTLKWGFVFLVTIIAAFVGVTAFIYPEYRTVLFGDRYYYSFSSQVVAPLGSIFGFLFVEYIDSFEDVKGSFVISSYILFLYYTIQAFQSGGVWTIANTGRIAYYSMSFSYGILFPVLIMFTIGFDKKTVLPIIIAAIGVFEIIIYGSRGALVVLMLYFILYMLWAWRPKRKQTKWILVSLASVLLILLGVSTTFQEDLVNLLIQRTSNMGYSSRLLSVLSSRSLFSEDRITTLWPSTVELIKNNILIGNGLYSNHYWNGGFAHNIILELLVDFGCALGGIFIYLLIRSIRYVFRNSENEDERFTFVILISFCLGRLMFSSSFWYEKFFWVYIACYLKLRWINNHRVNPYQT